VNKQIRRLGVVLMVCYIGLFAKLNQVQIFGAEDLNQSPNNNQIIQREYNRPRGTITSADNALLAQSAVIEGQKAPGPRTYPEGELFAHVTGFYSLRFGASGVEQKYNDELSGSTFGQQVLGVADIFSPKPTVGNVTVSVRKDLQTVARDALKNPKTGAERLGSVVVLDPKTGEILALWSTPSYNPNVLSNGSEKDIEAAFKFLNAFDSKPIQAKVYQETYPPGSTFKPMTAGVGVQSGKVTVDQPVYPVATSYKPPGRSVPISNFGGESCGGALIQILTVSCNSSFAEMGQATIGGPLMLDGVQKFGFNQAVPIDLPAPARSAFPPEMIKDPSFLAQASIGQNDVRATPLQMAMVSAAIANRGVIMKPHVMKEIKDSEGRTVQSYQPEPWITPLSPASADIVHQGMLSVVNSPQGTGTTAAIPGVEVAAKTGTAQIGNNQTDNWMISMAGPPGGAPQVVVAVVVLNQPNGDEFTGGQVAGPVAKQVMAAAMTALNAPPPPPANPKAPGSPGGQGGQGGFAPRFALPTSAPGADPQGTEEQAAWLPADPRRERRRFGLRG